MEKQATIRRRLFDIILLSRPLVLLSTFLSWFYGVSIAIGVGSPLSMERFLFGFASMLFASASIHYVNEYADYETDTLTTRTLVSGGSGVLQKGRVHREIAFICGKICLVLGVLVQILAIYLGFHSLIALPVLVIGIFGGWMYSLPPLKLAWKGLGEIDNALLGACILPFYGYLVMTSYFHLWVLLAVLPITFLAFVNLLAVTWPDRKADLTIGKRTLATILDPKILRTLFFTVFISSLIIHILIWERITPYGVFLAGLPAYLLILYGNFTYTKKETSIEVVIGLHLMIICQSLAWILTRFGIY